jgi:hypothetical protein
MLLLLNSPRGLRADDLSQRGLNPAAAVGVTIVLSNLPVGRCRGWLFIISSLLSLRLSGPKFDNLFRTPLMRPTPRFAHSGDCGAFVPPLLYSPEAYFLRAIPLGW